MSEIDALVLKTGESLKTKICILWSYSSKYWLSVCKSWPSTTAKEFSIPRDGNKETNTSLYHEQCYLQHPVDVNQRAIFWDQAFIFIPEV